MMKFKILKPNNKVADYLFQSFLIVISVLLALTLNQIVETRKINTKKISALQAIETELAHNQAVLDNWIQLHQLILVRLNDQNHLDSLINNLILNKLIKVEYLSDKSLFEEMFTDAAWTTSNSTGILSEFDFDRTQSFK